MKVNVNDTVIIFERPDEPDAQPVAVFELAYSPQQEDALISEFESFKNLARSGGAAASLVPAKYLGNL